MNISILKHEKLLLFSIPLLLILSMFALVQSAIFQNHSQELAIGVTLDLVLTLPFVYFLLIRKKDISKLSVASVFVLGMVIASFILPEENQFLLDHIKTLVFPVVETGVVLYLIIKARRIYQRFKVEKNTSVDFFEAINLAAKEIFPAQVGAVLATEIAVVYYTLFSWTPRIGLPNEFSYHKKSGIDLVIYTFMGILGIETFAMHVVIEKWSVTAAWVLTFLSVYTCIQLFALIRSMRYRPIFIDKKTNKLHLRYGFFCEAIIPLEDIEKIELTARTLSDVVQFSPLESLDTHNTVLFLKKETEMTGFYGRKKKCKALAVYLDDREQFRSAIKCE